MTQWTESLSELALADIKQGLVGVLCKNYRPTRLLYYTSLGCSFQESCPKPGLVTMGKGGIRFCAYHLDRYCDGLASMLPPDHPDAKAVINQAVERWLKAQERIRCRNSD